MLIKMNEAIIHVRAINLIGEKGNLEFSLDNILWVESTKEITVLLEKKYNPIPKSYINLIREIHEKILFTDILRGIECIEYTPSEIIKRQKEK